MLTVAPVMVCARADILHERSLGLRTAASLRAGKIWQQAYVPCEHLSSSADRPLVSTRLGPVGCSAGKKPSLERKSYCTKGNPADDQVGSDEQRQCEGGDRTGLAPLDKAQRSQRQS
jgi:hypothetical protein